MSGRLCDRGMSGDPAVIPDVENVIEVLQDRTARAPEKTVFSFLGRGEDVSERLTYRELNDLSRSIAAELLRRFAPGDRVLLAYPPGLDFIPAFYGCLYAGIVAVPVAPLNKGQNEERWRAVLENSGARAVLTSSAFLDRHRPSRGLTWVATDRIQGRAPEDFSFPVLDERAPAFIQYTSGSTGTPRGVVVGHRNLMQNARAVQACFRNVGGSVAVSWLPLYHDFGLIGWVIQPLCVDVAVVLMSPLHFLQKPVRWLKAISRYGAATSGAPNFAYALCVEKVKEEDLAELDLSGWSLAAVGAEPVRVETLRTFAEMFAPAGFCMDSFLPCYGLAEATLFVSGVEKDVAPRFLRVDRAALEKNRFLPGDEAEDAVALVGHGKSRAGQEVLIASPGRGEVCPPGHVGEILVRGGNVARGYWRCPEGTAERFQTFLENGEGPFLRTGDSGVFYEGELFIVGRLKDVIIIRGRNHYPQDVEKTVEQCHPALRPLSGVCVSVDGESVVVVQEVERRFLRTLDVEEVTRSIVGAVNEGHGLRVSGVFLLKPGRVPRTSSGKLRRRVCYDLVLQGGLRPISASPPEEGSR